MKKILKNIPLMLIIGLVLSRVILVSCTKEKVTTNAPDPNCPDTIKFSTTITDMMNNNCTSCHSNGGTPPDLTAYSSIRDNASAILASIGVNGTMPKNMTKLADSTVQKFSCWISQGKMNN
jgi:uncharacterized membrane protein